MLEQDWEMLNVFELQHAFCIEPGSRMNFVADGIILPKRAPGEVLGIHLMVAKGKLNLMESGNMECCPPLKNSALSANRITYQLAEVGIAITVYEVPVIQVASDWIAENRRFGRSGFTPEIEP